MPSLLSRITIDSDICHGKPAIRHLRYPVESMLEYLAGGDTIDDLLTRQPILALQQRRQFVRPDIARPLNVICRASWRRSRPVRWSNWIGKPCTSSYDELANGVRT